MEQAQRVKADIVAKFAQNKFEQEQQNLAMILQQ